MDQTYVLKKNHLASCFVVVWLLCGGLRSVLCCVVLCCVVVWCGVVRCDVVCAM